MVLLASATLQRYGSWDSWAAALAAIAVVVVPVLLAAPAVGCWLALRAGGRPAAGLTGVLVLPTLWVLGSALAILLRTLPGGSATGGGRRAPLGLAVMLVVMAVATVVARMLALRLSRRRLSRRRLSRRRSVPGPV